MAAEHAAETDYDYPESNACRAAVPTRTLTNYAADEDPDQVCRKAKKRKSAEWPK